MPTFVTTIKFTGQAFANDQIIVRHAQVVRTALAKRASDHLPILIDFHLKPSA